jgi:type II secretory pathway component PulF
MMMERNVNRISNFLVTVYDFFVHHRIVYWFAIVSMTVIPFITVVFSVFGVEYNVLNTIMVIESILLSLWILLLISGLIVKKLIYFKKCERDFSKLEPQIDEILSQYLKFKEDLKNIESYKEIEEAAYYITNMRLDFNPEFLDEETRKKLLQLLIERKTLMEKGEEIFNGRADE